MKVNLLFRDRDFNFGASLPPNHEDLIQDLELSTLLEAMASGSEFLMEVSLRVLLEGLEEPADIAYRQSILSDCVSHQEVVRALYAVAGSALSNDQHVWGSYGRSYQSPTSNLHGAVNQLEAYIGFLGRLRQIADDNSGRFESAGLRKFIATIQSNLDDDYFAQVTEHLKQLRFRSGVLLSAQLARDNSGINFVLRKPHAGRSRWKERLGIGARSSYSFNLAPRDEAGSRMLEELSSRAVNLVANAAAQSADHIKSYLAMLRCELGFYVGCLNLRDRLIEKSVPMSLPEPAPTTTPDFSCTDLRDISLVLQSDGPVVGNDIEGDGKSAVVITGANSGGKSTFLRSVGQAQVMMECGLFVAAQSLRANVARGVFTHFIREEDATMTSGRLDEELARMDAIADHLGPQSIVLFNESFAGTNEHEGSEIARQIVRALLEAKVKVFFVTHRFEFTQSLLHHDADSTLFLRAERLSGGRRTYKLVKNDPLPTSFGEDLYYRFGGWLDEDRQPGVGRDVPQDRTAGVTGKTQE